jgi:hypothetical protein
MCLLHVSNQGFFDIWIEKKLLFKFSFVLRLCKVTVELERQAIG